MVNWLKFETIDEAYNWGRWMMDLHGLQDWKLEFRKLAGRHGDSGNRIIHMDIEEATCLRMSLVMNTLLHEIAHALVYLKHGHQERQLSDAIVWLAENHRSLHDAADHWSIPVDDLCAYLRKGSKVKPHGMIWAKQAVAIGVSVQSECQANKRVIRRAMADAGIKDYSKINQVKRQAVTKAAKNASPSSQPQRPRT